ncbi:hypothetical protein CLOSTMETH_00752, partial [[Clostridium] methylpentosum DSM 5476]
RNKGLCPHKQNPRLRRGMLISLKVPGLSEIACQILTDIERQRR